DAHLGGGVGENVPLWLSVAEEGDAAYEGAEEGEIRVPGQRDVEVEDLLGQALGALDGRIGEDGDKRGDHEQAGEPGEDGRQAGAAAGSELGADVDGWGFSYGHVQSSTTYSKRANDTARNIASNAAMRPSQG